MFISSAAFAGPMSTYVYEKTLTLPTTSTSSGLRGLHYVDNLLYAVQNGSKQIQVVNTISGTIMRTISHANHLVDVTADENGNIWAVDDVGTGAKLWYADGNDTALSAAFSLSTGRAYGVTRDGAGNFYVCDPDGPIAKYSSNGTLLDSVTSYGSYAIALSPDESDVYIGGDANSYYMLLKSVCTIDFATNLPTVVASHNLEAGIKSIDVDPDGNIFAAVRNTESIYIGENGVFNYASDGTLLHRWNAWDTETGVVRYDINWHESGANVLGVIYGVAVDSVSDRVYVAQNNVINGDSHVLVFKSATFQPGDANQDGRVDDEDAAILAENWLTTNSPTWQQGDFNEDGRVDDTDAAMMAANWMNTLGGASCVPEPGVLAILASGLLGLPVYLRRRRMLRKGENVNGKKVITLLLVLSATFVVLISQQTVLASGPYIFASFRGEDTADGLHLAYSYDGYEWTPLRDDQSFMTPTCGNDRLRDPEIIEGPDGVFHMVWTCATHGFGYTTSTDLMNWSPQRTIPVSVKIPGAENTWAPDLFYDDIRQQYQSFGHRYRHKRGVQTILHDDDRFRHVFRPADVLGPRP